MQRNAAQRLPDGVRKRRGVARTALFEETVTGMSTQQGGPSTQHTRFQGLAYKLLSIRGLWTLVDMMPRAGYKVFAREGRCAGVALDRVTGTFSGRRTDHA